MSAGRGRVPGPFRLARRFAWRELRGGLRGFRLLLACLALGVGVIAAIGSIRASIEAGLAREGASLLGGDAELTFTYRFATEAEQSWMAEVAAAQSEVVEFRSMAVVGEERALTQVKSVDAAYPLRGAVSLTSGLSLAAALAEQDGLPGAVMERVLADRLGLTEGSLFRLGSQDFLLRVVVEDLHAFERFLQHRLTRIPGIRSVRSRFALRQFIGRNRLPSRD